MAGLEWSILVAALGASLLTLISGFGLGTLLLPVLALFFPLELAVGITAVVHLLNNMFKFGLLWRHVDRRVLLWFGIPGIAGAWVGALLLVRLSAMEPLYMGVRHAVDPLALVIAVLMAVFAITELVPTSSRYAFGPKALLPGGIISGFFGGLSGHQGALRTMFLLRSGLSKEAFIATGIAIALLVDLTRIPVYLERFPDTLFDRWPLIVATTLAAFLGAWWGKKLIPKITMRSVQLVVGVMMLVIAAFMAAGVI